MTQREARQHVALGVEALMGAAGENAWLFEDREGRPRSAADSARMVREFNLLALELGRRGAAVLAGER